jgi:hypothetical protein
MAIWEKQLANSASGESRRPARIPRDSEALPTISKGMVVAFRIQREA